MLYLEKFKVTNFGKSIGEVRAKWNEKFNLD